MSVVLTAFRAVDGCIVCRYKTVCVKLDLLHGATWSHEKRIYVHIHSKEQHCGCPKRQFSAAPPM